MCVPAEFAWPVPDAWPDEVLAGFEPLVVAREAVASDALAPEYAVHAGIRPSRAAAAFAEARSTPGKSWIDLTEW